MNDHITGDTPGAEGTPSATRIAHIARVRSRKIQGTMSGQAILEATRTSTNLRRHTERVQEVLAQYGEHTVDPSDPKGRTYYDIASQTMPALIPGVDCPDGPPRAGIDCRYHSGCYAIEVNKDLTPELLPIVRQVLEQWPHTTLVSRSVSHQALWALLHGPRATSDHECTHYQQVLMEMLPDSVRPHVAEAPSDLTRARHWAWDPDAVKGPDIEAVLYPPPDPDEPHHGTNGEVPPVYSMAMANGWRARRRRSDAAGGATPESPGETANQRSRVSVGTDLHTETQTVIRDIAAWNTPPAYFSNPDASAVVEVVAGEVRPVSRDRIAAIMSAACTFVKRSAKGKESPCYPPPQSTGAVYAELARHLPPLHGIKRAPFYCGGIIVCVTESGYHSGTGYWCDQGSGWDMGLDIEEALRRIDDLLNEFPYEQPADRATAFGMLIGQALKVEFQSPILEVSKPASQTGASKLCQTIACLADGREPATITASVREEETDKRIIGKLRYIPQGLLIDNVSRKLTSDVVASGMTSTYTGGRLLGVNDCAAVLTKALQIYVTGNNESLSRDMVNRAISVRLDAQVEHPEERTGFRHQLPSDALTDRVYFYNAALSLVQRWIDAGKPPTRTKFRPLDSFRPWMDAVAGILYHAGINGFNQNRQRFLDRADESGAEGQHFVSLWLASKHTTDCSTQDLLEIGEKVFTLRGNGNSALAKSLGHRLAKLQDRVFTLPGGLYTVRRHHSRTGTGYSLVRQKAA